MTVILQTLFPNMNFDKSEIQKKLNSLKTFGLDFKNEGNWDLFSNQNIVSVLKTVIQNQRIITYLEFLMSVCCLELFL